MLELNELCTQVKEHVDRLKAEAQEADSHLQDCLDKTKLVEDQQNAHGSVVTLYFSDRKYRVAKSTLLKTNPDGSITYFGALLASTGQFKTYKEKPDHYYIDFDATNFDGILYILKNNVYKPDLFPDKELFNKQIGKDGCFMMDLPHQWDPNYCFNMFMDENEITRTGGADWNAVAQLTFPASTSFTFRLVSGKDICLGFGRRTKHEAIKTYSAKGTETGCYICISDGSLYSYGVAAKAPVAVSSKPGTTFEFHHDTEANTFDLYLNGSAIPLFENLPDEEFYPEVRIKAGSVSFDKAS